MSDFVKENLFIFCKFVFCILWLGICVFMYYTIQKNDSLSQTEEPYSEVNVVFDNTSWLEAGEESRVISVQLENGNLEKARLKIRYNEWSETKDSCTIHIEYAPFPDFPKNKEQKENE